MKLIRQNWKKCLILLSALLCLIIAAGNIADGTWTFNPSARTVEARKNKKNKKKNNSGNKASNNSAETSDKDSGSDARSGEELLDPDGTYTSKEDVALYIHQYGELPQNFITKKEARDLGWSGGSLEPYAPGKSIGGSRFGNYEGQLPEAKGRTYYECDIDTLGKKSRGAKRIVYSDDGLIYYTEDHYETFELLYGEE